MHGAWVNSLSPHASHDAPESMSTIGEEFIDGLYPVEAVANLTCSQRRS